MFRPRFRVIAPVALLLAVGCTGRAVAADPTPMASAAPAMSGMGSAPAAGTADAEMRVGMQRMQSDMRSAPMTGDPDHDFVAMMLPHHQGAVAMAEVELRHGRDPSLLKLAHAIVAAQDREIAFMKAWLSRHPDTATAEQRN